MRPDPYWFQSTPRFVSGANCAAVYAQTLEEVSIHTPLRQRGERAGSELWSSGTCFNPHPASSAGRTRTCSRSLPRLGCFNPHPASSAGRTGRDPVRRGHRDVSIHTPLRQRGELASRRGSRVFGEFQSTPRFVSGANQDHGRRLRVGLVSIHTPLRQRGELTSTFGPQQSREFQSTPRFVSGANIARRAGIISAHVSIHTPLRQRGEREFQGLVDRVSVFQSTPRFVSGANPMRPRDRLPRRCFNPHPASSAGRTRLDARRALGGVVSIHTPLRQRGEQGSRRSWPVFLSFQSTPRFVSGANRARTATAWSSTCFNPHPASSAGRTCRAWEARRSSVVSIHTPLRQRGEPQPADVLSRAVLFQSTPRFVSGANPGGGDGAHQRTVSIHTPLRQRGEPSRPPRIAGASCFNPHPASSAGRTTRGERKERPVSSIGTENRRKDSGQANFPGFLRPMLNSNSLAAP